MAGAEYELASTDPDSPSSGRRRGACGRVCLGCPRWAWVLIVLAMTLVLIAVLAALYTVHYIQHNTVYQPNPHKLYMSADNTTEGDMLQVNTSHQSEQPQVWPHGIVLYRLSDNIGCPTSARCAVLFSAIGEIENRTCLQWISTNDTEVPHVPEVLHIRLMSGEGCYSSVGYQSGGSGGSLLALDYGCFDKGIIMHLLGHVIGFWHEHNRWDRDDLITVNETNVDLKYGSDNFNKYTQQQWDSDGPMDLQSVMMYGPGAFSSGQGPTLVPQDPAINLTELWKRPTLSEGDVGRIQTLYEQECSQRPQ